MYAFSLGKYTKKAIMLSFFLKLNLSYFKCWITMELIKKVKKNTKRNLSWQKC